MAGINQGVPETAIGEPIRLGDSNEFEIEQHPVSDRLIIRDTQNGKVAYVRKERGGEIGGDGVLIKALKEGKPMADDGRTYDTIQQAERAASSWVFVPPGTFNESVSINTEGLTLRGSGYNTLIDGGSSTSVISNENNVTLCSFSCTTQSKDAVDSNSKGAYLENIKSRLGRIDVGGDSSIMNSCVVEDSPTAALVLNGDDSIAINNRSEQADGQNFYSNGKNCIIANNIMLNAGSDALTSAGDNHIIIGNIVKNSAINGIEVRNDNVIIANNRVSDSTNNDIEDQGTENLFDANLTGASN